LPGYGRTGGNPVLIAGGFSLALVQSRHRLKNDWNLFASCTAGHGAPLMWLPLITVSMGTYLMNGYSIFKERPVPHSEKQVEGFIPSPVSSLESCFSTLLVKKLFNCFFCRVYGLRHSLKRTSF